MPIMHTAIVNTRIDLNTLIEHVAAPGVGAVSVFLGTVRDINDGRSVTGIDYEAYEAMAVKELEAVAEEVCAATPELRVALEHRVGTLRVGDVSIAIVAGHPHRAQACDAARAIIELVKVRVPIWKREHYEDGSIEWVDPTASSATTRTHSSQFSQTGSRFKEPVLTGELARESKSRVED